jgi:hypothetical protein
MVNALVLGEARARTGRVECFGKIVPMVCEAAELRSE